MPVLVLYDVDTVYCHDHGISEFHIYNEISRLLRYADFVHIQHSTWLYVGPDEEFKLEFAVHLAGLVEQRFNDGHLGPFRRVDIFRLVYYPEYFSSYN
jgi:hypothetical protein